MSRAVRVAGVLLVCVLAVAGCASLAALRDLGSEVQEAGYDNVNVNHQNTNGHDLLVIEVVRNEEMSGADADRIAGIAWRTYQAEFDELQIVLNGEPALSAGPDELASRFGERPDEPAADPAGGPNVTALVVILVCAAAFAVVLVLLWRRGRRPPPGSDPRFPPQFPPNPYPYGPPNPYPHGPAGP
jgi:hypothetical protein